MAEIRPHSPPDSMATSTTTTSDEIELTKPKACLAARNTSKDWTREEDPQTPLPLNPEPVRAFAAKWRSYLIIANLSSINFLGNVSTGLIMTCIPKMAIDLSIPAQTYYWPLSVYGLTSGASLLVAGAVADVVGSKRVFLTGNVLQAVFTLGCGLARTNAQLSTFRALHGVAVALCLPTSVGLLTSAVAPGRRRNIGFACTGVGQSLGFSFGLVLGGVSVDTAGWRVGWYAVAATLLALAPVGIYVLPTDTLARAPSLHALRTRVDWVGALIISGSLTMLAYVLLQLSESEDSVYLPCNIALLVGSLALMPAFGWWMSMAARCGRPVLIPNGLWRRLPFASVCLMVLLSYAVMQTMQLFCTLFFQSVQGLDALQSSVRLLPSFIVGSVIDFSTGMFIHRVSPAYLVFASSLLCAGGSVLMALADQEWPYWYAAFPAQILQPMSADVLFCVGLVIVSELFPDDTQSLAGAVFNMAGQFGTSIGLALMGVVADSVTRRSRHADKESPEALGEGYRAAFWTAMGWMLLVCLIALVGLKGVRRVGLGLG
ncbi:Uu.00g115580.m01.CDS01 [Anthostomella pinea]|uniref:Uu.00g115580.m01.CDS01 n=1 Tax=Anthostomella pinea TaxID=933095 RepID=A0AAI8VGY2_9PEZI|nr:Uu.00g115580.m01.CDS01 [Anthostomella pinea]